MELLNKNKEYELSDEVKLNFNIMSTAGKVKCLNYYLKEYFEEEGVYGNYISYILHCGILKKIDNSSVFNYVKLIKKYLKVLPFKFIEYLWKHSKVLNIMLNYTPYVGIPLAFLKNKDMHAVKYLLSKTMFRNVMFHDEIIRYLDKMDKYELFEHMYIELWLNNGWNIKLDIDGSKMFDKYYLEIREGILQKKVINVIVIKDGKSSRKRVAIYDLYKGRTEVDMVEDIIGFSDVDDGREYIMKKGNYKFTIYTVLYEERKAFRFGLYDSIYKEPIVKKVETFIY
jgi:hypothetical protein